MHTKILAFVGVLVVIGLAAAMYIVKTNPATPQPSGGDLSDLIQVDSPKANETVSSPLTITGKARGTWYFEASFPVKLINVDGNVLAQGPAQAQGDWMTSDFVPFTATLTFNSPVSGTGTLILHNDNPSGLLANDQEIKIPVRFSVSNTIEGGTGTVSGYVHMGPTCPVMRIPPDPQCDDRPYVVSIEIHYLNEKLYSTIKSGADGKFSATLPAGEYILRPIVANVMPRCGQQQVTVVKNQTASVDISCDTGIR